MGCIRFAVCAFKGALFGEHDAVMGHLFLGARLDRTPPVLLPGSVEALEGEFRGAGAVRDQDDVDAVTLLGYGSGKEWFYVMCIPSSLSVQRSVRFS